MQVCGPPLGHAPQWALGEQGSLHALYGAGSGARSLVCGLHAPPAYDSECCIHEPNWGELADVL